jgi:predicted metalloprotease
MIRLNDEHGMSGTSEVSIRTVKRESVVSNTSPCDLENVYLFSHRAVQRTEVSTTENYHGKRRTVRLKKRPASLGIRNMRIHALH